MCSSMKKSEKFGWFLQVKFWHFMTALHYSNSPILVISVDYRWFLAKNLSNFVSLPWKLHNRYCHISSILHQDLKHSTSCRDVTSSFYHIKDLWNQMGWQEVHNNRSLLAASVDVINSFTINIDKAVGVNFFSRYILIVENFWIQFF